MWRLSLQDIAVGTAKTVLDGVSAQFSGGEMAGVIGSNGVGKKHPAQSGGRPSAPYRFCPAAGGLGEVGTRRDIAYVPQLGR